MEKKFLYVITDSEAHVYCFEDFDECEDLFLELVNNDIYAWWHLKVTIDKWTNRIEHSYITYNSNIWLNGEVKHLYRDEETWKWIILQETVLNPVLINQWEEYDANINNQK